MNRGRAILLVTVVTALALAIAFGAASAGDDKRAALGAVAEEVRNGKVDVGKTYGMAPDARFHRIHTDVIGLECASCHVDSPAPSVALFTARPAVDISPNVPGPVDRRNCQGCHRAGPARDIYGTKTP